MLALSLGFHSLYRFTPRAGYYLRVQDVAKRITNLYYELANGTCIHNTYLANMFLNSYLNKN